jgi:Uma2 family endonuclease
MEVDEFLAWEGEPETRHELRDGVPVAMAPPTLAHAALAASFVAALHGGLKSRPVCMVYAEAGIRSRLSARSYFVADVAVSCAEPNLAIRELNAPVVVVEIMSPATAETDRRVKLREFMAIETVHEIVLADPRAVYVEVHRRLLGDQWHVDLLRGIEQTVSLRSLDVRISLEDLYRGLLPAKS